MNGKRRVVPLHYVRQTDKSRPRPSARTAASRQIVDFSSGNMSPQLAHLAHQRRRACQMVSRVNLTSELLSFASRTAWAVLLPGSAGHVVSAKPQMLSMEATALGRLLYLPLCNLHLLIF